MHSLAPADPYVRTFSATVHSVDGTTVVLDESYFYPEGGGQPADRGTIDGVEVVDVQSRDDRVVHELATTPSFESNDTVDAAVDDGFRTYCMRAHTASHVLYGAGRRLFDDLGYGGFDIGAPPADRPVNVDDGDRGATDVTDPADAKVRVDFETNADVDDAALVALERLTNRAVWASYDVSWEELPREDALSRDDVAFNVKTEEGLSGETVRIVTVADWDVAACGGTHVSNTSEIGPVTVLDRSNPGEGMTRVEFTVGPWAIARRARERQRAMDAATMLDTGVDDLPDAVATLRDQRDSLQCERDALRGKLVDATLSELRDETFERDGQTWLVGSLPGLDANGLSDRAQSTVDDGEDAAADVAALVGEDGDYLAVATTGDVDAGDVVAAVTDEFGGGGGGSPTIAQAGGLDATAGDVVAFLRESARFTT